MSPIALTIFAGAFLVSFKYRVTTPLLRREICGSRVGICRDGPRDHQHDSRAAGPEPGEIKDKRASELRSVPYVTVRPSEAKHSPVMTKQAAFPDGRKCDGSQAIKKKDLLETKQLSVQSFSYWDNRQVDDRPHSFRRSTSRSLGEAIP